LPLRNRAKFRARNRACEIARNFACEIARNFAWRKLDTSLNFAQTGHSTGSRRIRTLYWVFSTKYQIVRGARHSQRVSGAGQRGCRIRARPELTCGCGPVPRRVSVVVRGAPRLLQTLGGWAWGYVAPSLGLGARRCWRRATGVGNQNRVFEGTVWQLAWLRDMTHSARTHSYHANLPL